MLLMPDNLDATSVNTVMQSRRSIPSMFVKSIKELPFDVSVVCNTKLVKYYKQSSLDIQRRKMKLLSKTRRFKDSRYLFFSTCLAHPIDVPFLSSKRVYLV